MLARAFFYAFAAISFGLTSVAAPAGESRDLVVPVKARDTTLSTILSGLVSDVESILSEVGELVFTLQLLPGSIADAVVLQKEP